MRKAESKISTHQYQTSVLLHFMALVKSSVCISHRSPQTYIDLNTNLQLPVKGTPCSSDCVSEHLQ